MQKQIGKSINLTDIWIIVYLISIYVFAITTGETYISKLASLPMLAALLIYVLAHEHRVVFSSFEKGFILFILVCFCSCFWAQNFDYAFSKVFTLFQIFVFMILIHTYVKQENKQYILVWGVCIGGVALALYTLYYYGFSAYLQAALSGYRMGADLANVNTIGNLELFPIIILFWCIYYRHKWIAIIPMGICLIVALGTGSRKVVACIMVGILLLYLLKGQGLKKLRSILFAVLAVIALYMIVQLPGLEALKTEVDSLVNLITRQNSLSNSDMHRMELISLGFNTFFDSPIWGVGIGNTRNIVLSNMGFDYYLHNNYLEILASVGLLGAMPYFYLWLYPIKKHLRNLRIQNDITPLIVSILLTALVLQIGQVIYYDKVSYFLLLLSFVSLESTDLDLGENTVEL